MMDPVTYPMTAKIPITKVSPHPDNPRFMEDADRRTADDELEESIRASGNLVMVPIIVRKIADEKWQVLDGHRRLAAVKRIGTPYIDAQVIIATDDKASYMLLELNLKHKSLAPPEEARAIANRMQKFGKTQTEIAKEYGRTQQWVSQRLGLLPVAERPAPRPELGGRPAKEVTTRVVTSQQKALAEDRPTVAREVAAAPAAAQASVAKSVVEKKLTHRQTVDLVKAVKAAPPERQAEVAKVAATARNPVAAAQNLSRSLKTDPAPSKPLVLPPENPFIGSTMHDVFKKVGAFTDFWYKIVVVEEAAKTQPDINNNPKTAITYRYMDKLELDTIRGSYALIIETLTRHTRLIEEEQKRRAMPDPKVVQFPGRAS